MEILMYHHICADDVTPRSRYEVTARVFRKHMEYLVAHGFHTPHLADIAQGRVPSPGRKSIMVTFDDGYMDVYDNALPILKELGLTAVLFIVTDFSRSKNWWDKGVDGSGMELLSKHHIAEMAGAGIEFGTHTFSHAHLPSLEDQQLSDELTNSLTALQKIVTIQPAAIAYPYGSITERVKAYTRKAGYALGFAAHSGPLRYSADPYEIRRVFMSNRSSLIYLWYKFSGTDRIVRWITGGIKRVLHLGALWTLIKPESFT
jgi:peptidoglycan/xylan/chitin deacetylase (PgdA/CDA1 family)